jgi:hypothetical protein
MSVWIEAEMHRLRGSLLLQTHDHAAAEIHIFSDHALKRT